jgi:hypothetical protein
MGWADCGKDSRGRRIGYAFNGKCDFKGCGARINRGLSYACGGMHGEECSSDRPDEVYCEGYYCERHFHAHDCEALRLFGSTACASCGHDFDIHDDGADGTACDGIRDDEDCPCASWVRQPEPEQPS